MFCMTTDAAVTGTAATTCLIDLRSFLGIRGRLLNLPFFQLNFSPFNIDNLETKKDGTYITF
jgi:hypothetical protein